MEDPIDHSVGLVFKKRAGESVAAGEALCVIHHNEGRGLAEARSLLDAALCITQTPEVEPLILDA